MNEQDGITIRGREHLTPDERMTYSFLPCCSVNSRRNACGILRRPLSSTLASALPRNTPFPRPGPLWSFWLHYSPLDILEECPRRVNKLD